MNKITKIVAEYLKDSEFTDWMNRPYFPEEEDFIKKYKDLTEDDNLASLIAEAYESEIDWHEVRETWWDYNKY
jgi:hypothetical protein